MPDPVTVDQLIEQMKDLKALLDETDDVARAFELGAQLDTLEIARQAAILDPLTDINNLTVVDVSKLNTEIAAARAEIQNIKKRNEAIGRAMMIVKGAIKAAGIAF